MWPPERARKGHHHYIDITDVRNRRAKRTDREKAAAGNERWVCGRPSRPVTKQLQVCQRFTNTGTGASSARFQLYNRYNWISVDGLVPYLKVERTFVRRTSNDIFRIRKSVLIYCTSRIVRSCLSWPVISPIWLIHSPWNRLKEKENVEKRLWDLSVYNYNYFAYKLLVLTVLLIDTNIFSYGTNLIFNTILKRIDL